MNHFLKSFFLIFLLNISFSVELYPAERAVLNDLISSNNLIQPYDNIAITLDNAYLLEFIPFGINNAIPTIQTEENCLTTYCRIVSVDFSNFNVTTIPESFSQLIMLQSVKLSNNNISEIPYSFYNLSDIQYLDFSYNNLTEIYSGISSQNQIYHLNLSSNSLTSLPTSLSLLHEISFLNISLNNITEFPFSDFPNISSLFINGNKISELNESFCDLNINWEDYNNIVMDNHLCSNIPSCLIESNTVGNQFCNENQQTFLQTIINQNNIDETSSIQDQNNNDGNFEPIELGYQRWELGQIVELNLSSNPINNINYGYEISHIPSDLSEMISLQYLDLGNNQLTEISNDIGLLVELKSLRVDNNYITGNLTSGGIPTSIGYLGELEILSLANNFITIPNPAIYSLTNLKELYLNNNQIYYLDNDLGNLELLNILKLNNNEIATIPNEIRFLDHLNDLNASYNQLSTFNTNLRYLSELLYLDFSNNYIQEVPSSINQMLNLREIKLNNNQISLLPIELFSLFNLRKLHLQYNSIYELEDNIGNLTHLEEFKIHYNQLHELPQSICYIDVDYSLPANELNDNLSFQQNFFCFNLPSCIAIHDESQDVIGEQDCYGSDIQVLSELLEINEILGSPANLGIWENERLVELNMSNQEISILPNNFGYLAELRNLNLSQNNISEIPSSIGFLINLDSLNLNDNNIGTLPETFSDLESIQNLKLSANLFSNYPDIINELMTLKFLEINNNSISQLLNSISNLESLLEFDISGNELTIIPEEIEDLINLIYLNISNNNISFLPVELEELSFLEIFLANNNQLILLPEIFSQLNNLIDINLSNNFIVELEPNFFNSLNLEQVNLANNNLLRLPNSICEANHIQININDNYLYCVLGLENNAYYGYMDTALLPECIDELENLNGLNIDNQGCEFYGCTADQNSPTGEALNYDENSLMSCSSSGAYEDLNNCCLYVEGPEIYVRPSDAIELPGSDVSGDGSRETPFASIQKAVRLAGHYDVVIVDPGEYYENINIEEKDAISIYSQAVFEFDESSKQYYIDNTIINGSNFESCFNIENSGDSLLEISGFTLRKGRSETGGGINVYNSKAQFNELILSNNSALTMGGGVFIGGSSEIEFNNSKIDTNLSVTGSGLGGGLFIDGTSTLQLNNTEISRNKSQNGGGLYLNNLNKKVIIKDCLIKNNTAISNGGGLFNLNDSLNFLHYVDYSNEINDTILTIFDNNSAQNGGGIYQQNYDILLQGIILKNNTAEENGGGIYSENSSNQFNNLILLNNTAEENGGGIYSENSNLEIFHLTMFDNLSNSGGVVHANNNSNITLYNTILWNNDNSEMLSFNSDSDLFYNHSIISNYLDNANTQYIYPEFSNLHSFELSRVSNAIGGGENSTNLPLTDLYGNPRILSQYGINENKPDLGAVENQLGSAMLYDWFVSFNGDDSFSGLDLNEPIQSINLAIEKSLNGDRIYIKNGNYSENIIFNGKNVKLMNYEYYIMGNTECGEIGKFPIESLIIAGDGIASVIKVMDGEDNVEICGLTITEGESPNGGGIYVENANPKLSYINIIDNYSYENGGGIYGYNFNGEISNVTVLNNISSGDGGGIYLENSSTKLENIIFQDNHNRVGNYDLNGGGLYLNNSLIPLFENMKFLDNHASKNGGGLYLIDSQVENAIEIEFISNHANQNGGGIYSLNSEINFSGAFIANIIQNDATINGGGIYLKSSLISGSYLNISHNNSTQDGGGVFIDDSGKLLLSETEINNNTAIEDGGAISLNGYNTELELNYCKITNNLSETSSILYANNGIIEINNTLIEGNRSYNYPGGILAKNSNTSLLNITMAGNKVNNPSAGGNLNIEQYGSLNIINSIIWNNDGVELYLRSDGFPKSVLTTHTTFDNGRDGIVSSITDSIYYFSEYNNTDDPLFISPDDGFYYITKESPCVDAGTSLYPPNAGGNIDTLLYISEDLIVDGDGDGIAIPDMGAFDKRVLSVFPGDLNNDGVVSILDVADLAIYYNISGIPRYSKGINWNLEGHGAIAWDNYDNITGSTLTHADANGDGVINERDVLAIGLNWENEHIVESPGMVNNDENNLIQNYSNELTIIYNSLSGKGEGFKQIKSYLERLLNISAIPIEFSLSDNFPNPFNPTTNIYFSLPKNNFISMNIYNIKGELIRKIIDNKSYPIGNHSIKFEAINLPSGIYFYNIKAEDWERTKKMMLVK